MNFFTTKDDAKIFFKDTGRGTPVILIHGWPLSADMWDEQTLALLDAGYRVIAYDRRGFGRSEQTADGYNYDTLASDLDDLIQHLNVDQVSLIGFSMGGGEVARYLGKYGSQKIISATLISAVVPYLLQTPDNKPGVPSEKFLEIENGIRKDRFAFFHKFFKDFYGVSMVSQPVSNQALTWSETVASQASLKATIDCVNAFGRTDFRKDMTAFDIPTLIIHGTADKTVPIEPSAEQAALMIEKSTFKRYEGAAHGINLTHKDELNKDIIEFLDTHSKLAKANLLNSSFYRNKDSSPTNRPH